jgi:hypothetical protein
MTLRVLNLGALAFGFAATILLGYQLHAFQRLTAVLLPAHLIL